jgi:hypothetical protein
MTFLRASCAQRRSPIRTATRYNSFNVGLEPVLPAPTSLPRLTKLRSRRRPRVFALNSQGQPQTSLLPNDWNRDVDTDDSHEFCRRYGRGCRNDRTGGSEEYYVVIQSGLTGSTCNFSIGVEALCARTGTGVQAQNRRVPRVAAIANLNFPTFTTFSSLVLRRRNALLRPLLLFIG